MFHLQISIPKTFLLRFFKIPERLPQTYKAIVFGVDQAGNQLVAMEDPDDIEAVNLLQNNSALI